MLDIRCIYHDTITLHTPDHQLIVIGEEIGRAQQTADMHDVIIRHDPTITDYGDVSIISGHDHLAITYHNQTLLYTKKITQTSFVSGEIFGILLDISEGYEDMITVLQALKPSLIVLLPTVDQDTAIQCASTMMREGLSVPKYLKEGQYVTIG